MQVWVCYQIVRRWMDVGGHRMTVRAVVYAAGGLDGESEFLIHVMKESR